MTQETFELARNAFLLVVLLVVLYGVGRTLGAIGDARTARLLAPYAPAIGGTVDRRCRCIQGSFKGRELSVSHFPKQSVGTGESATYINAFQIEVTGLPGRHDWQLQFMVTSLLGQGPKELAIMVRDPALRERLQAAAILDAVAAVSAPTTSYVTVAYEARRQTLTYTGDMRSRRTPSPEHFARQLDLIAQLARVNEEVNPA